MSLQKISPTHIYTLTDKATYDKYYKLNPTVTYSFDDKYYVQYDIDYYKVCDILNFESDLYNSKMNSLCDIFENMKFVNVQDDKLIDSQLMFSGYNFNYVYISRDTIIKNYKHNRSIFKTVFQALGIIPRPYYIIGNEQSLLSNEHTMNMVNNGYQQLYPQRDVSIFSSEDHSSLALKEIESSYHSIETPRTESKDLTSPSIKITIDDSLITVDEYSKELPNFKGFTIKGILPVIEIDDDDVYVDDNGNKYDIEILNDNAENIEKFNGYGYELYFRVSDISKIFNILKLQHNLNQNYYADIMKNKDVFMFYTYDDANKYVMYLKYWSLIKVMMHHQIKQLNKFNDWIINTFIRPPIPKMSIISPTIIKSVFNRCVSNIPAIYIFNFGKVHNLRESMNIPENYKNELNVYKFGRTNSLSRRIGEINNLYSKIPNVIIDLNKFAYVDEDKLHKAEANIKEFITTLNLRYSYENHQEIFIASSVNIKSVYDQLILIEKKYNTRNIQYRANISDIKMQHSYEINELKLSLKDKEIELLKLQMSQSTIRESF